MLFYPHINGDKTLYSDPTLRGAFLGLSSDTGTAEMYNAVVEGLCFAFRQLGEAMGLNLATLDVLKAVGGGAKSDFWLQTMASVLNVRVERLSGAIGAGFGVALLAWRADHPGTSLEELTGESLNAGRIFSPDSALTDAYQEKYARYLRIHDALKYVEGGNSVQPLDRKAL